MIDPATGMKAGERYIVESLERTRHFPGFFLDGKYYLSPELMTAIGWLEGQQFYFDELDPTGEPVFPNRLACTSPVTSTVESSEWITGPVEPFWFGMTASTSSPSTISNKSRQTTWKMHGVPSRRLSPTRTMLNNA
jgi:hypothetical protein